MTFVIPARLKGIPIPTCQTFLSSQMWLRVRRWPLFTLILLASLGAAQRSAAQNTIYVNTPVQGNSNGLCSLQEAIYSAEFGDNIAIGSTDPDATYTTGCVAGSGNGDTIVLQSGATYSFKSFWDGDAHNPFGPTATPIIFKTITIVGNGATLQPATGAGNFRLFAVGYASFTVNGTTYSGTGNLTLRHVYIKNFQVKGGDGADGGGGGLGAGGAIYIGKIPSAAESPSLAVENSAFDSNGATGGNGGASGLGGGGGGLGGGGGRSSLPGYAGGGGGGARGDGGKGSTFDCTPGFLCLLGGGGGGGTVFSGGNGGLEVPGPGGFDCGGTGGDPASDGHSASCPGGGGGGGGFDSSGGLVNAGQNGGNGEYGGGGGGASGTDSGGNGGFGGGGGSAGGATPEAGVGCGNGGNGDFGGGGAGAGDPSSGGGFCIGGGNDGVGGKFGGKGSGFYGGGGAALGGAIFNDSGSVVVQNTTFYNNSVGHGFGGGGSAVPGADAGGAIFSRNGSTTIQDATISGNQATGAGAGVEVMNDSATTTLVLENAIIAGNNGTRECIVDGSVTTDGSTGNLIVNNGGCPNVVVTSDPLLDSLKPNVPGDTPTMALLSGSPAIGAGDPSLNATLPTDQRGVQRKDSPDIGAFETVPLADLSLTKAVSPSTAKAGNTVTYTLTLNNLGPDTANDVAFADFLPTALTFVSCSASGGAACSSQGGFLVVSYATLAANDPQTIIIKGTVKAGSSRGIVTNQASVSDASPLDPDPSNNSSSASFTVLVPDFSVTAVSPINIVVGGSGTSTVTVGSIDTFSSAVSLTASGPSGFQEAFSSNPVTPPSNSSKSSILTMSLGPSVAAGSYTVHVSGTSGALTHTTPVSVTVQATIAGITNVIGSFLTSLDIDKSGIANSLTSKLSTAQTYISAGDSQTAVNVLDALINQLNAQSGKHIAASAASALIIDTQALQTSLGANLRPDPTMGYVVNSSNVPIAGATVNVLDPWNAVVATATTDSTGFYFFPLTRGWTLGQGYTVKITLPKGYKTSTPTSQQFTWQASQVVLTNFVLN